MMGRDDLQLLTGNSAAVNGADWESTLAVAVEPSAPTLSPADGSNAASPSRSAPLAVPTPAEGPGSASRFAVTMAWGGICSSLFWLILPATLAADFGTVNCLIGTGLTVVLFGLFTGQMASHSVRLGMSSAAVSEQLFGRAGGAVPTLILCLTCVWYAVFEGSVLAVAASRVMSIPYWMAVVIVALYSAPMSVGSVQKMLNRLNGVLLPFYLVGLVLLVVLTVSQVGYSNAWLSVGPAVPAPSIAWWNCMSACFSMTVASMISLDYAYHGKPQDASFFAWVTFGIPFHVLALFVSACVSIFVVGSLATTPLSETAVVDCVLTALGPAGGLAWIFVTQTRINTANYFIGTLNLQAFLQTVLRRPVSKVACGAVVGIVTFSFMLWSDVFAYLLLAMAYQGVVLTAWVAIAYIYMLSTPTPSHAHDNTGAQASEHRQPVAVSGDNVHGDRHAATSSDTVVDGVPVTTLTVSMPPMPAVNMHGMCAWVAGVIVGLAMLWVGGYTATASAPATLAVSGSVYAWFCARQRAGSTVDSAAQLTSSVTVSTCDAIAATVHTTGTDTSTSSVPSLQDRHTSNPLSSDTTPATSTNAATLQAPRHRT